MSGGEISENEADFDGGGVYVSFGTFTMSSGVVFGKGADADDVVYIDTGGTFNFNTSAPTDDGIVIAWNDPGGTPPVIYIEGTDDDLIVATDNSGANPAGATAVWAENGGKYGIDYANDLNTGFIEIAGVEVVSTPLTQIDVAAIGGVTVPVAGATPVVTITPTAQYTGSVTWTPADDPFVVGQTYTATIVLTPEPGYTLAGVSANYFTVAGATSVSNAAGSGTITATFPTVTVTPTYVLTVVSGTDNTATGPYPSGTPVSITANAAPSGQVFDRWTTSGGGSFVSATSATTTFTMPAAAVTVTATYRSSGSVTPPATGSPGITGPAYMSLSIGYTATSTGAYTITGATPVTVTKSSGDDKITWNNSTRKLDIAAGLAAGVYTVKLVATNSVSSYTFTFTLTVGDQGPFYYLDLSGSFPGGKVDAKTNHPTNPYLAEVGSAVTLTVTSDKGYELDEIVIYKLDNNMSIVTSVTIPLSGSGNTFTFIMPGHNVVIAATFNQTVGVEEVQATGLKACAQAGVLYVDNLTAGQTFSVYNLSGILVYQGIANSDRAEVALPGRGVYVVTDGKVAVKVIN